MGLLSWKAENGEEIVVEESWKAENGKAIVVCTHGVGVVLCYDGPSHVVSFAREEGWGDGVECRHAIELGPLPDGVWLAEVYLKDDGPGDYPGTREFVSEVKNFRHVTVAEWREFSEGNWPWETDGLELSLKQGSEER